MKNSLLVSHTWGQSYTSVTVEQAIACQSQNHNHSNKALSLQLSFFSASKNDCSDTGIPDVMTLKHDTDIRDYIGVIV